MIEGREKKSVFGERYYPSWLVVNILLCHVAQDTVQYLAPSR